MHGSRNKIPFKKSCQAALHGGFNSGIKGLSTFTYNQDFTKKMYYILMPQKKQCGASCESGFGKALLYEFNHIGNAVIIHGY
jgi:hypothetical protein